MPNREKLQIIPLKTRVIFPDGKKIPVDASVSSEGDDGRYIFQLIARENQAKIEGAYLACEACDENSKYLGGPPKNVTFPHIEIMTLSVNEASSALHEAVIRFCGSQNQKKWTGIRLEATRAAHYIHYLSGYRQNGHYGGHNPYSECWYFQAIAKAEFDAQVNNRRTEIDMGFVSLWLSIDEVHKKCKVYEAADDKEIQISPSQDEKNYPVECYLNRLAPFKNKVVVRISVETNSYFI